MKITEVPRSQRKLWNVEVNGLELATVWAALEFYIENSNYSATLDRVIKLRNVIKAMS